MDEISQILDRGVAAVYPNKENLLKVLMEGKKLTIYYGIDPSGTVLHLGHAVILKKLAQFQKLGHKIILLIGDFTGTIGDPTDKLAARVQLTKEEVRQNASKYQEQASKILNFSGKNPAEIKYNHNWLSKLTLEDVVKLASHFTVQQMIERDMFEKRIKDKKPIFIHEFLYPLMQGYDSVAMNIDLEIGGSDQTFNMLIGRELVKIYQKRDKFVLTTPILPGTDGKKMGKSENNFISITENPNQMYRKVMEIDDNLIGDYSTLLTDLPLTDIEDILNKLKNHKLHPLDAKKILADNIVRSFHGNELAKYAKNEFENVLQRGENPRVIPDKSYPQSYTSYASLATVIMDIGFAKSKSDAKNLISQNAIKFDGNVVTNFQDKLINHIKDTRGIVVSKGDEEFIRIRVEDEDKS